SHLPNNEHRLVNSVFSMAVFSKRSRRTTWQLRVTGPQISQFAGSSDQLGDPTMTKILALYYSSYGHMEAMIKSAADGARETGADVTIMRVPELVPEEVARSSGYKMDQEAPVASAADLEHYDGFIFGVSTRYGMMSSQM